MSMIMLDKKALEGLPLKLLITVMIIALSVQPLFGSLSYLAYAQNLGGAVEEAEAVKRAALSAFIGGPGNVRKVTLHLGEGSASFSIRLGGDEGEGRSRTIDVLWHGNVAASVALEGQGLSIISLEGKDIIIDGNQDLRLSCWERASGDVVIAEVL